MSLPNFRMTLGSVCSGIGGAELAFAGLAQHAFMAEIASFPRRILKTRFPNAPLHRSFVDLIDNPLDCSLLVGGTPCQAFSILGLRESLNDDRGNLALQFIRLADSIDAERAIEGKDGLVVLWENVCGALSTKDNAFGCFLAGLVGESSPLVTPRNKWADAGVVVGPQRTAAWRVLDAQYFGLAQRRRRLFVVASSRQGFDPVSVLFECESMRRDSPPSRDPAEAAAGDVRDISQGDSRRAGATGGLTPAGVLAFGGNNTAGPIDIATACRAKGGTGHGDFESETFIAYPDGLLRRLTPAEYERLQGVPDGWTVLPPPAKTRDGSRYKAVGNGFAIPVVRWIARRIHQEILRCIDAWAERVLAEADEGATP